MSLTISSFLIFGLAILLLLFVLAVTRRDIFKRSNSFGTIFFFLFCCLGIAGSLTVRSYMYPKDPSVFNNTDYHILKHKGFRTDSVFYLVKSQYPDDYFPDMSLWDSKSGVVKLTFDSIYVSDYCEPFFVERKKSQEKQNGHKCNSFVLVNKYICNDISDEGLILTKNRGTGIDTVYQLRIVPKDKECLYISSSSRNRADTSNFRKFINVGYPLSDIISQTVKFDFNAELQELLEGTILVREEIGIEDEYGRVSSKVKNNSSLIVSPGTNLYYSDNISINGSGVNTRAFSTYFSGRTLFYSGSGRTQTDVYCLNCNNKDKVMNIEFALPKMQKLREEGGRLFITSSVEKILEDSKDGGYYYNIFDSESNFNHINGEIRYLSGTSLERMQFEIIDAYSSEPGEKRHVVANEDFELNVRSHGAGNVQWIFEIEDLRESNPLQFWHIFLYILFFIILVGIRIYLDYIFELRSLSFIELSSYIVVLCLCVVRLILGWRVSTFVPIEDIAGAVYDKMRKSIYIWTLLSSLFLPLVFCLITILGKYNDTKQIDIRQIWKSIGNSGSALINRLPTRIGQLWECIKNKFLKQKVLCVIVFYICLLALCYFFGYLWRPSERFMNILAPSILYLLFDLWLIKLKSVRGFRILLALIALAYLFIKDAGFAVVFMVFLLLLHFVIEAVVSKDSILQSISEKKYGKLLRNGELIYYFISLLCAIGLVAILWNEGYIMIWIFNHIHVIILSVSILMILAALLLLIYIKKPKSIFVGMIVIFSVVGISEFITHAPSEQINSKEHMKYRAEVQKLAEGQKLDELIEKCDFKSSDITFIMRSAHNQWFINQYLKAGQQKGDTYFKIQPHSNQGSTYTTQTTDLVITRYLQAEHGKWVIVLIMAMFFMLIMVYWFETEVENKENRVFLGALLLLFVIALMVFLSATNRVVFIGQDFPFISLQSKVTCIFSVILLMFAILPVTFYKLLNNGASQKDETPKWASLLIIGAFAAVSIILIRPKGENQKESQFDVSQIIHDVSEKIEVIDNSFIKFQLATGTNRLPKDSLWKSYVNDAEYSKVWKEAISDTTESNRFFSSLLDYFNTRQDVKNNPEELIHMRKRSGYWHLAVNKKHYFIPSKLEDALQWHGDLLASKTERYFSFIGDNSKKTVISNVDFETNILPKTIQGQVKHVAVSKFDSSWSDKNEPIILITSNQAKGSKQFFDIESSESIFKGAESYHQLATLITEGDVVTIKTKDKNGDERKVLRWRYGRDNENYLAKNIWMNGSQRLFYPLGKESMWSYQFANMVSNVFGKDNVYRDSTLRISIDYDLHRRFHKLVSDQNKTKLSLRLSTLHSLQDFEVLPYSDMQNRNNATDFYFDTGSHCLKYKKRRTAEIENALKVINGLIRKGDSDMDMEYRISNAIAQATERKFDFSAVVVDGNGRIRLLFDHVRTRNIDPNNIRYFNKCVSDLYKNGDNQSERDVFGNKALQILPSGPGSSFKPIAYTSITSQEKIAWESLDVRWDDCRKSAMSVPDPASRSNSITYDYYGGVDAARLNQPLSIDGKYGFEHNNYLIHSNNLYHSVIILLGMQSHGRLLDVFKPAGSDKLSFPVMNYNGQRVSFNPDVWFPDNRLNLQNGIMNDGLFYNFHLQGDLVGNSNRYTNYFGDSPKFRMLFEKASNYRSWAYAETGSQNIYDRELEPGLRNGFNQMLLGAYPLEVTPLQMAIMGMRLASFNSAEHITTIDDGQTSVPDYMPFNTLTWESNDEYFRFFKRQVLSQMRQVPLVGTAKALKGTANALARGSNSLGKKFYMYAKTGTLNDERANVDKKNSRMKHLLVIISDTQLENVSTIEELKKARYYVMYFSYIGINKNEFSFMNFKRMIDEIVNSEQFIDYMKN